MNEQSLAGIWEFRQSGEKGWDSASVPGGVHTDLLALGRIPDPFVGDNERRVQWVAEVDWEYRQKFLLKPELLDQAQIWLICDGLDTLATVTLNGLVLGQAENMFRQYRWEVKERLNSGENELRITFKSPVRFAAKWQAIRPLPGVSQAIAGGPYIRKAPCQFGWDWGPQLPPIGIWKDIRLEGYEGARIRDIHLRQQHRAGVVMVEAEVSLQDWKGALNQAVMRVTAPDDQVFEVRADISSCSAHKLSVIVPDVQLWWPNGYGAQPLYRVSIELRNGDRVLDRRDYQLGLRTLELRQQPDEWGRSFTFVVNGQPIFAKGSNWIPADSFPTRISEGDLEKLIQAAADTHQNMLRVWGGGFYEEERFYDLCDRYGILVWQDFIFSCSVYPLNDPAFLENVQVEVVENIRRLRHRASLALWCGNNEMEQGWAEWGWKEPQYQDLKVAYDEFFHRTLPAWCAEEDPERAYWPSSPSSNTPFEDPNGQQQGDAHYWDVWHGRKPFTAYRQQYPRFMSEFGFQALPPLATIRTYAEKTDWNMTSYIMEQHQKNDSGNALMVAQMLDTFRLPGDFEALVYLSLALQAEGIRYGVEHWRRNPKRVSGVLYWQLNDCWPVASWSSVDYYGRWKALHYAARRFYAPLLLSIEDHSTGPAIYITNDQRETWEGTLHWSLETLGGRKLEAGEGFVTAIECDATKVCQLDFADRLDEDLHRDAVLVAELWQAGSLITRQMAFFAPTKHLKLSDPGISAQIGIQKQKIHVDLTCQNLARLVECSLEGADVIFSDNYFDLPAGRVARITAALPEGWTRSKAQKAFSVRSVYNSFAYSIAT